MVSRRDFLFATSGAVIGSAATLEIMTRGKINERTSGRLVETEDRYLSEQPQLDDGIGTIWAVLLNSEDEFEQSLSAKAPDRVRKRLTTDFSTYSLYVAVGLLPEEDTFKLSNPSVHGNTITYTASVTRPNAGNGNSVFHYHYYTGRFDVLFNTNNVKDGNVEWI